MLLLNGFSTSYLLVTNLAFQSTFQMSVKKPKLIKVITEAKQKRGGNCLTAK